jgi:hypothetical protein
MKEPRLTAPLPNPSCVPELQEKGRLTIGGREARKYPFKPDWASVVVQPTRGMEKSFLAFITNPGATGLF